MLPIKWITGIQLLIQQQEVIKENLAMKKIMVSLLAAIMIISFCACGKKTEANEPSEQSSITSKSDSTSQKNELIYNSTDAFDYAEVENGIIITYFKNYDYVEYDKIIVPESIDGKKVVGIGELEKSDTYYGRVFGAVFGNCEVVIPSTVTYIGGLAFNGAKGLVKLSGGENCTVIGEYAFMSCENLTEITFIDNVSDLPDNAFLGCSKWNSEH